MLCLGKSLVIILDYIRTAGPLRTGALLPDNGPGPVLRLGKVREHHVSRKKRALSPNSRRLRTAHGVPDPLYSNRTSLQGKESTPRLGVVRGRHVSASAELVYKAAWSPY